MKTIFFIIATVGFLLAGLNIWVGNLTLAFILIGCSSLNVYNFITWDKRIAKIRARQAALHEALMEQYTIAEADRQRKIDELYGK
jgi:hypothetical protein